MLRMVHLRVLAARKGFDLERHRQRDRVVISHKGIVMRRADGVPCFSLSHARDYLKGFPDADAWTS